MIGIYAICEQACLEKPTPHSPSRGKKTSYFPPLDCLATGWQPNGTDLSENAMKNLVP
jgi:hypothetical protein